MTGDTMAGLSIRKAAIGFAAAIALVTGASVGGSGTANAQNYDGDTVVRFGMFGQTTFQNFNVNLPNSGSASSAGFSGGFSGGLDYHPHPAWLIGAELGAAVGEGRASFNNVTYGFDYLATLRGRFGVYPNQDWLLYGTAGIAYLGFEAQNRGSNGLKAAETVPGALVGLGAEYKWRNMFLFAEYDYTTFSQREFSLGPIRYQVTPDLHLLRFGIKFNVGSDFGRMYEPD